MRKIFIKESPWTNFISDAILKLSDNGELQELYLKWWKTNNIKLDEKCSKYDENTLLNLRLTSGLIGVFVLVLLGLCLACFMTILEKIWFNYWVIFFDF